MNSSLIDEEIARWWIDFFQNRKKKMYLRAVIARRDC